jgi:predicted dehydrogenase
MDYVTRRKFMQGGALAAAALCSPAVHGSLLETQPPDVFNSGAPGNEIRFGIIGVGMEGSSLLTAALALPGVKCVGAADLYDGRQELAREITGDPKLPVTRNYQELLGRTDVDCVVAAVPDFWHKQVAIDACNAGKPVYCEKPMSYTVAEGFEMVHAAESSKIIVQIGAQRLSSAICKKTKEMYQSDAIGDVTMVELSLGRNSPDGAWEYPPPADLSPSNLAWDTWLKDTPKIPFDPYKFARWRCWKDYSTGVAGDMMVHLVSAMLFTFGWNSPPDSAICLGGISRWKDGRDMPDLQTILLDYHGIPVYVSMNFGTDIPERNRYMGPKGFIDQTNYTIEYYPQAGVDTGPSDYGKAVPQKLREEYLQAWHMKNDPAVGKEPLSEHVVFFGDDQNDLRPHLWNFFEAVKGHGAVVEDAAFGNIAAIACHMANESYFRKQRVFWDAQSRSIRS